MFHTEKFIKEIEGNPSIWDIAISDYQNRGTKINAWGDICKITCDDKESLDVERKRHFGK
jgi:hypothetical protein